MGAIPHYSAIVAHLLEKSLPIVSVQVSKCVAASDKLTTGDSFLSRSTLFISLEMHFRSSSERILPSMNALDTGSAWLDMTSLAGVPFVFSLAWLGVADDDIFFVWKEVEWLSYVMGWRRKNREVRYLSAKTLDT